jgi:hypothetical protein
MTNIQSPSTDFIASTHLQSAFEVTMKTQAEIEASVCEVVSRFEQDYMGRDQKRFTPTCSAICSWSAFNAF